LIFECAQRAKRIEKQDCWGEECRCRSPSLPSLMLWCVCPGFRCAFWEILNKPSLEKGQSPGSSCPRNAQFRGICLKESQPPKRPFAGQMAPLKPTFDPLKAPLKQTFALIPWDFRDAPPGAQRPRRKSPAPGDPWRGEGSRGVWSRLRRGLHSLKNERAG